MSGWDPITKIPFGNPVAYQLQQLLGQQNSQQFGQQQWGQPSFGSPIIGPPVPFNQGQHHRSIIGEAEKAVIIGAVVGLIAKHWHRRWVATAVSGILFGLVGAVAVAIIQTAAFGNQNATWPSAVGMAAFALLGGGLVWRHRRHHTPAPMQRTFGPAVLGALGGALMGHGGAGADLGGAVGAVIGTQVHRRMSQKDREAVLPAEQARALLQDFPEIYRTSRRHSAPQDVDKRAVTDLATAANRMGIYVYWTTNLDGGAAGLTHHGMSGRGKKIEIDHSLPIWHQTHTLAHELGHAVTPVEWLEVGSQVYHEMEADAISYLVCRQLGCSWHAGGYSGHYEIPPAIVTDAHVIEAAQEILLAVWKVRRQAARPEATTPQMNVPTATPTAAPRVDNQTATRITHFANGNVHQGRASDCRKCRP